jgi:hypothetical protein
LNLQKLYHDNDYSDNKKKNLFSFFPSYTAY